MNEPFAFPPNFTSVLSVRVIRGLRSFCNPWFNFCPQFVVQASRVW